MSDFSPAELRDSLGNGLLSFPVSHFDQDLQIDTAGFAEHVEWLDGFNPSGFFVAGGTGEFFSLVPDEVDRLVRTARERVAPGRPVIAPVGYGTAMAVSDAEAAAEAGADGLFVLPPYLTEADPSGLEAHVRAICAATELGVILYHRANAVFTADVVQRLAEDVPNFVGFKDGIGDVPLLATLCSTLGDRLLYIGGLPTAETYALPYLELGATTYSSAIFNFAPDWASRFYAGVRAHDRPLIHAMLRDFVIPYLRIRDRRSGYAVSIVKSGLRAVGRSAGPVRPPLLDLTESEDAELAELIRISGAQPGRPQP